MNNWIFSPLGLLLILLWHWLLDFVLKYNIDAQNKWHSNKHLTNHTIPYSLGWCLPAVIVFGNIPLAYLFIPITFVAHTITDWFTSRWCHYYFEKGDTHRGFVVIGFDQILHYVQLYLTFKLILSI